ncbi:phage portal protein [Salinisphaera sp. LB1]|uniref:phage portal protein n=1 Tax=Salinisphaera sp. LB1 TaxID=2183911 RepID=UPI0011AB3A02|nr:phage portal protein [Salinisphaera sp. LB1]
MTLLRPLPAERWANHQIAIQSGAMTPNEVRHLENLPRVEGMGDELLANASLKPIRIIEKGDQQAKAE